MTLQNIWQTRYELLAKDLEEPTTTLNIERHFPFNSLEYAYSDQINLYKEPWSTVCKVEKKDLISGSPFERSKFRPEGYSCWDSIIALPVSKFRTQEPYKNSKVIKAVRQKNPKGLASTWVTPFELKVPDSGTLTIKLPKTGDSWNLLEYIHVMTHMRYDRLFSESKPDYDFGFMSKQFHKMMAEVLVALLFDLPIVLNDPDTILPGGLNVYIDFNEREHVMMVPAMREPPKPDKILSGIFVTTRSHPMPYGFITKSLQFTANDRWCCLPTTFTIVGWEGLDFIAHQALVKSEYGKEYFYGVHPDDLLPISWLKQYIDGAKESFTGVQLTDLWGSKEFEAQINRVRALPCSYCMSLDMKTIDVPEKPRGRIRRGTHRAAIYWDDYVKDLKKIALIALSAAKRFSLAGELVLFRNRKERIKNHKKAINSWTEKRIYNVSMSKMTKGRKITKKAREIVERLGYEGST